jgi:DedD protein
MEAPLQQRIVGAIVLVTLGVIFIPALLDGSGYKSRQVQNIKVKEKPEFPALTQKKVKPIPTPLKKNVEVQEKARKADTKKLAEKPIKSFALQVGTYNDNKRAEKFRDKLRKAGYTAYVYKAKSSGKTRYKVRIGPELEYSVLEKLKVKIKKSHKIDAFIVNHP